MTQKRPLVPANKFAIAKTENQFTNIIFPNFAKGGHQYGDALLHAIISGINQNRTNSFDLDVAELQDVVLWKQTKHLSFSKALQQMLLDSQNGIFLEKGRNWNYTPIILNLDYLYSDKKIHIDINTKVTPLFLNTEKRFTKTLTHDYALLRKNAAARALYTILRKYRQLGKTEIYLLSDILIRFSVPKSYLNRPKDIENRIFARAIRDIEKYSLFTNIKFHRITKRSQIIDSYEPNGKRILGYYFSFSPQRATKEVSSKKNIVPIKSTNKTKKDLNLNLHEGVDFQW